TQQQSGIPSRMASLTVRFSSRNDIGVTDVFLIGKGTKKNITKFTAGRFEGYKKTYTFVVPSVGCVTLYKQLLHNNITFFCLI
ncbi:MAG: hypothetical protein J6X20_00040, partial [Bacteroidales bacterium]|nr:hypothetical protein [Bacteroidales bacterium]